MIDSTFVVVKINDSVVAPYIDNLSLNHPGLISPELFVVDFDGTRPPLDRLFRSQPRRRGGESEADPVLRKYFRVVYRNASAADQTVRNLNLAREEIEFAYVQKGGPPPGILRKRTSSDPLRRQQSVLDEMHMPAGLGADVLLVDIEEGWELDHPELTSPPPITWLPYKGENWNYHKHGSSVLQLAAGRRNQRGIEGASPMASLGLISRRRDCCVDCVADAITSACDGGVVKAGDVLLVEAQSYALDPLRPHPIEIEPPVFRAIQYAIEFGVIVVEPVGNGCHDLDGIKLPCPWFSLASVGTSGALLVGAASELANTPWSISQSEGTSYGSLVDCCARGEGLVIGDRNGDPDFDFEGTSGSAALVAGVVVGLQSTLETRLTQQQLSKLVRTDACMGSNVPGIGRLPDYIKMRACS